jgi:hypothetical protein
MNHSNQIFQAFKFSGVRRVHQDYDILLARIVVEAALADAADPSGRGGASTHAEHVVALEVALVRDEMQPSGGGDGEQASSGYVMDLLVRQQPPFLYRRDSQQRRIRDHPALRIERRRNPIVPNQTLFQAILSTGHYPKM